MEEDIGDVVTRECLLNVATFYLESAEKLTYVELDSGSFPDGASSRKAARANGGVKERKEERRGRKNLEELTSAPRTKRP